MTDHSTGWLKNVFSLNRHTAAAGGPRLGKTLHGEMATSDSCPSSHCGDRMNRLWASDLCKRPCFLPNLRFNR